MEGHKIKDFLKYKLYRPKLLHSLNCGLVADKNMLLLWDCKEDPLFS